MNYKEQLLIDINKIYKDNTITNKSFIDDFVKEIIEYSPNDGFIISITPKWYKRSQSIEFVWNLDDLDIVRYKINYRISETDKSWNIEYCCKKFNNKQNDSNDFFKLVEDGLNEIREARNELVDWLTKKPTTQGEFYNELVSKVDMHIAYSIREEDYNADKMVLGINLDNFRPEIDEKEFLSNHDIYDLGIYTKCFFIDPNDGGCGSWELENDAPFWQLAEKYITDDVKETRISQRNKIKKITSNDFRMCFYHTIYRYLTELNQIKSGKTPFYLKYLLKSEKKRYLGIEPYSLKPFIGIIDSLDGCDIYDLKTIEDFFAKDENGFFVSAYDKNKKFLLKDKSIIELLTQKYFTNEKVKNESLPLVKTAAEHILDDDSLFVKVYKGLSRDKFDFYPTIIGKYHDTSYCDKYCFRPRALQDFVEFLEKSYQRNEENTDNALKYYYKAKEHKRNRKYKLAITALEKAITLVHNIEQTGYPEIHSCLIDCYAKIKDKENQIRVLKLAIDLYGSSKFKGMLNKVAGTITETILNKDSYQVVAECNYGEMYDKHVRRNLPEFSFGKNKIDYRVLERAHMLPVIRQIDKHFHDLLNEAKEAETLEYYDKAVELYERLIAEGTYTSTAYERLIVLYSKANRKNDLIRILQSGISFFEARKSSQAEYARALAKKYNAEEYCEMCIRIGLTIPYNYGYIVLYQNYPFVDKWKKRLAKLMQ